MRPLQISSPMDSLESLDGADDEETAEAEFNGAFEVPGERVADCDQRARTTEEAIRASPRI